MVYFTGSFGLSLVKVNPLLLTAALLHFKTVITSTKEVRYSYYFFRLSENGNFFLSITLNVMHTSSEIQIYFYRVINIFGVLFRLVEVCNLGLHLFPKATSPVLHSAKFSFGH